MNQNIQHLDSKRPPIERVTIWPQPKLRIAVLEEAESNREFVGQVIRMLGHTATEYLRPEHLVSALTAGARFDIVLAAFGGDQNAVLSGARILRHAARCAMPVLLMMRPEQFRSADTFVMDSLIDFMLMPCEECELIARLVTSAKAMHSPSPLLMSEHLVFGRYRFEPGIRAVGFNGERIQLKPQEFDLALFLFRNAGVAQSRETLFGAVWVKDVQKIGTRTIDVHIANIRKKLKINPGNGVQLSSIYGMGYVLFLYDD